LPVAGLENTTTSATGWLQVACIATTLRHLILIACRRWRTERAASRTTGCCSSSGP
jgi:hypothetical protein